MTDPVAAGFRPDLFAGRTVFVTGGTSGIGAETAGFFHGLGASVIAAGLAAHSAPLNPDARLSVVELDVTDHAAVKQAIAGLPRLDHLILCAGVSLNAEEFGIDAFRRVIDINLVAAMTGAMAAAPLLGASGGSIVTLASMYAFFGGGERPAYAASKGGIVQLTKSLAQHFAPTGVRVNAVAPGWIETPLARNLSPEAKARIIERIPQGRWGRSSEIAATIAFLCSPAASYITGAILAVDGGYLVA